MRVSAILLLPLSLLTACADQSTSPIESAAAPVGQAGQAPFLHTVHVGGQDICAYFGLGPGCDGNFSLVAFQHPDGSVSGSWTDGPFGGNLTVDCLDVVGNEAWIGGVDRTNPLEPEFRWISRVVDAGQSANDPPDSVSRRHIAGSEVTGNPNLCRIHPKPNGLLLLVLGDGTPLHPGTMTGVPQGQVRVE
jgi:hypothetical protein